MRAVFLGEEDVVILAGVEGRIEIDEIDGLVFNVALEDFVVVAVVKLVGHCPLFNTLEYQCDFFAAIFALGELALAIHVPNANRRVWICGT